MSTWQTVLVSWLALQLPVGILVGRAMKSSFAGEPHPRSETAARANPPPGPARVVAINSVRS
jgi:hypothetical protein